MSKPWREGGSYPQISFYELNCMTGMSWMQKKHSIHLWKCILEMAQAEDTNSNSEGHLPAYYSFIEELCWLHNAAMLGGYTIPWWSLPRTAMTAATPKNWEFIGCAILDS